MYECSQRLRLQLISERTIADRTNPKRWRNQKIPKHHFSLQLSYVEVSIWSLSDVQQLPFHLSRDTRHRIVVHLRKVDL